jgi:hypothetical protein
MTTSEAVHPGSYQRYDGVQVEVIYVTEDIDTGREILVRRDENRNIYTITLQSFQARTEWQGLFVTKYKPLELPSESKHPYHRPRQAADYDGYAKDLCEHFAEDYRNYRLCVDQKQYFIPKEDFQAIKEDVAFVTQCLKTVLSPYNGFFKGRYMEEMSIRKYAQHSGKNRGSVEYTQKKFLSALAYELQRRDETDGKIRLAAPEGK